MFNLNRFRRSAHLTEWIARRKADSRLRIPTEILDLLTVEPLQCVEEDDLQGISPNLEHQFANPEPPIYAMKFCPVPSNESILGIANEDGNIAFQDINKFTPRMPLTGMTAHTNAIFDFAWCPTNANRLVTVSGDQRSRVWDLETGSLNRLRELRGHSRSVKCCQWKPDCSSVFATGARDNNILIWDLRVNSDVHPDNSIRNAHSYPQTRKGGEGASVTGLVWLNDTDLVSVGGNDGVIKVWDLRKNYSLYRRDPIPKHEILHPGTSFNQGYSDVLNMPGSCFVFVSCLDNTIYKYNIYSDSSRPVGMFTGATISNFFIKSSLSYCGNYLASGSTDNNVYLWNTNSSGDHVATLQPQEETVTCVTWNYKEHILASCTDDMRHRIWRPQRCFDKLKLKGSAVMTGKRTCDKVFSLSPSKHASPSVAKFNRMLKTPTSDRTTKNKRSTPSIKSFLTPKDGSASKRSPVTPGTSTTTPTRLNQPGKKRRLLGDDFEEPRETKVSRTETVGRSINDLLSNTKSPVKCQFSPSTYKSPVKKYGSPRSIPSPFKSPLGLARGSPTSSSSAAHGVGLDSPLRAAVRRPLEALESPTANLPNMIRDRASPNVHLHRHDPPPRKVDWLTRLSKEKQKIAGPANKSSKTPKSKKKIAYKT